MVGIGDVFHTNIELVEKFAITVKTGNTTMNIDVKETWQTF